MPERNRPKGSQMPSRTTGFEGLLDAVPDALVGVDQSAITATAVGTDPGLNGRWADGSERLTVRRELMMIELKQEIAYLRDLVPAKGDETR